MHATKKYPGLWPAAFFALYMFAYMATLTMIDQRSMTMAGPAWQLGLHYGDALLAAAGFAAYGLVHRRPALRVLGGLLYVGCVAGLAVVQAVGPYSLLALATAFGLGVLGGLVYTTLCLALAPTAWMGRVMAGGASAAILLQYLLQERLALPGMPVLLAGAGGGILWLAGRIPRAVTATPCPPDAGEGGRAMRRKLAILAVTVVALSLIGTFYDTQMMRLNVQSGYREFNYYAWPRLFLMAGYGLIGCLGDWKKQAYVPIATLCVALFAVFNPLLFGRVENYQLNMCLYYTCLGANVAYYNLMFWNLAPATRRPALWASMGRVISALADTLWVAVGIADLPMAAIIGIDISMFVVLVLALAAGGYLLIGPAAAPPPPAEDPADAPLTPQQRLLRYAAARALTPRETEVLEKLLTTEDGVQEIADSLYISRRMLQRYIASIYEKTDTKTRIGLFQSYTAFADQDK